MMTSGMHRRPFEGRHLVLFIELSPAKDNSPVLHPPKYNIINQTCCDYIWETFFSFPRV